MADSLVIQGKHKKFTDLSFLKNLEIIHGLREFVSQDNNLNDVLAQFKF